MEFAASGTGASSRSTHLAGEEDVLPLDHALGDLGADAVADFRLVAVDEGAIDVPVAGVDGVLDGLLDFAGLGLEGEKYASRCSATLDLATVECRLSAVRYRAKLILSPGPARAVEAARARYCKRTFSSKIRKQRGRPDMAPRWGAATSRSTGG